AVTVPIVYTSPETGGKVKDWLVPELQDHWTSCSPLVPAPPGTSAQFPLAWLTTVLVKASGAVAAGAGSVRAGAGSGKKSGRRGTTGRFIEPSQGIGCSVELDVIQFRVSGAAGEVGRALGQPDHVVAGVQGDGGGRGAELAPAGGRRIAHRRPLPAVVGKSLGGNGSGAVRGARGQRVGP